ncbi:MAG: hypothetical protein HF975_04230 [ANME-2 cluster archaeon]|nr:hypothetical protein [ANME-2 cluster archaeon]
MNENNDHGAGDDSSPEQPDILFATLSKQILDFKKNNIILIPPVHDFKDEPIEVSKVEFNTPGFEKQTGKQFVAVRPVDDTKTYLGIYLGGAPAIFGGHYNIQDKTVVFNSRTNPMIFIPDLMTSVFGYECWWSPIKDETQLRRITDDDIQNVWYVKALKELENISSPGGDPDGDTET